MAGEVGWDRPFFRGRRGEFEVIAHRGGEGQWPGETVFAFKEALNLGVDVIEMDVRSTSDGKLVLMHDATVGRTTNGTGRVAFHSLKELQELDAGYKWTDDGGLTFKYRRGREHDLRVPTLEEVFETFPRARMNIEIKQLIPSVVRRLAEMIVHHKMEDRVLVGSFYHSALRKFRALCPRVATSASVFELAKFVVLRGRGVEGIDALQVRPKFKLTKVPVITEGFVRMARERGLPVHAWTVNDRAEMARLRRLKIDGIITDYPECLLDVLRHGDGVGGCTG